MPNTNVFRGSDATLTLAVDNSETEEGKIADSLITEYDLSTIVGRLQQVEVQVANDVRPYHEIGKRFPAELRPGNINIAGTAKRAHINGALLRLLLGEGAKKAQDVIPQPVFNINILLKNPALPEKTSTLTIFGVKFDTWQFSLPEDNFVLEDITFKALRIATEETE